MEIAPAPAAGPAGSGLRLYEESDWEEFTLYKLFEEDVLFTLQPATHTKSHLVYNQKDLRNRTTQVMSHLITS